MPDANNIPDLFEDLPKTKVRTLPALHEFAQSGIFAHYDSHCKQPMVRHHVIAALRQLKMMMPDEIAVMLHGDLEQIDAYVSYQRRMHGMLHKRAASAFGADTNQWVLHPAKDDYAMRLMGATIRRLHTQQETMKQATDWQALVGAYKESVATGYAMEDMPNLARLAQRWPLMQFAKTLQKHCLASQGVHYTNAPASSPAYAFFVTQVRQTLHDHADQLNGRQEPGMDAIRKQVDELQERPPEPQKVIQLVLALMKQASTGGKPGMTYQQSVREAIAADIALHHVKPHASWNDPLMRQHPLAQFAYRAEWQMLAEQMEARLKEQFPNRTGRGRGI